MAEEIDPAVEDRLRDAALPATLATCADGRPHAASLWYRYSDGIVEIVTTGRKLENLRENPRAALSILSHEEGLPEWEITLLGTATVIDDDAATRAATKRINAKYGVSPDAWAEENTLVRIDVGSASLDTW